MKEQKLEEAERKPAADSEPVPVLVWLNRRAEPSLKSDSSKVALFPMTASPEQEATVTEWTVEDAASGKPVCISIVSSGFGFTGAPHAAARCMAA